LVNTAVGVMSQNGGLPKSPSLRGSLAGEGSESTPGRLLPLRPGAAFEAQLTEEKGPNDSLSTNDPIEILRNINTSHVFLFFMSTVNFHKTYYFFIWGNTTIFINQGLLIRG